jgi:hypothetical protein
MSAEQFVDAASQVTGVWQEETKQMSKADSRGQGGQLSAIRHVLEQRHESESTELPLRAALADADALQLILGRPNREQVVTQRDSAASTLEALEFTNGQTLDRMLRLGSQRLAANSATAADIVNKVYAQSLGRTPTDEELQVAVKLVGSPATIEGIQDFVWTILMLPEFQFIE